MGGSRRRRGYDPGTLLDAAAFTWDDPRDALAQYTRPPYRPPPREADILRESIESEARVLAGGSLAGPLRVTYERDALDFGDGAIHKLPAWVEPDALAFERSAVDHVVAIEKWSAMKALLEAGFADRRKRRLLVCLQELPTLAARRFLHRLSHERSLPVYLLADGDTWGYFLFSVLRRGMITPGRTHPRLAIDDVLFLGVRANDVADHLMKIRSRSVYAARIAAFRRDPVFASLEWSAEFDSFLRRRGKFELEGFLNWRGVDWAARFLERRIRDGDSLR